MENLGKVDFENVHSGKVRYSVQGETVFALNTATVKKAGYFTPPERGVVVGIYYTETDVPDLLLVLEDESSAKEFVSALEKEHRKSQLTVLNFNEEGTNKS